MTPFNGRLYAIAGYEFVGNGYRRFDAVYSSADGVIWRVDNPSAGIGGLSCIVGVGAAAIEYQGRQLYLFSDLGIWSTTDGSSNTIFFGDGSVRQVSVSDAEADCNAVFSRIIAGGYSNNAANNFEEVRDINVQGLSSVMIRVYGANFFMRNVHDLSISGE
jgi:hypothetical protein